MAEEKKDNGDVEVKLTNVRLSFSDNLFSPEQGEKRSKGKHSGKIPWRWSSNFLIPKDSPEGKKVIEAVKQAMRTALNKQWPTDPPKIKNEKLCMRNGDDEDYTGYAGHLYVSASRTAYSADGAAAPKRPFKIIGPRKEKDGSFRDLSEGESNAPYAGCYVNAIVRVWAQDDQEYGKRINASIEAVQFARHGEAFGGGRKVNVDEAFDDVEGDDGFGESKPQAAGDDGDDMLG